MSGPQEGGSQEGGSQEGGSPEGGSQEGDSAGEATAGRTATGGAASDGAAAAPESGAGPKGRGPVLPVRPLRLVRALLLSALLLVPAYAAAGAVLMMAAAALLAAAIGRESAVAAVGSWSVTALYAVAGLVAGAVLGAAAAAERTLRRFDADLREWFERMPPSDGGRLLPAVRVATLRGGYEGGLDAAFEQTLGRLPVPRVVTRYLRARAGDALMDDFLAACERKGTAAVGFTEVRDWLLVRGLPLATRPFEAKVRVWRWLALGALASLVALAVVLGVGLRLGDPRAAVLGLFALAALLVLFLGLPRARSHASPMRWRAGVVALALCVGGWPAVYLRLWSLDLGMAWLAVVGVTLWTVHWSLKQALLEADRPRALSP